MPGVLTFTILCKILFLKLTLAADTLTTNQIISNHQTLISQNRHFELGFFAPSPSNTILGIRYTNTPDVIVWVANRDNPIKNGDKAELRISTNGTIVISDNGSVIWSSGPVTIPNPILQILDTGNLVVKYKAAGESSYVWQSFDHPYDTRLPGMYMVYSPDTSENKYLSSWKGDKDPSSGDFSYRIENKGLPQMVILRRGEKVYRSGMWNGVYINVPTFYNKVHMGKMVIGENRTTFVDPYNSSILSRLVIEGNGLLRRYTMDERKKKWNLVYTIPKDPCDDYGNCGPNGICTIEKVPICACLKGFAPKDRGEWDFQDWSGGCSRIRPLNCGDGDGFLELKGMKYPDMVRFWLSLSTNITECRELCLRKCNCTAYAQPYLNNGGSGCLMWFGDLVDTRVLPGANANQNVYMRLPLSELETLTNSKNKTKKRHGKLIPISVVVAVLISVLICGVIVVMKRRKRRVAKSENEDLELPIFNFATIAAATNNFSEENIIGEGGFGPVYKGNLSQEEHIAVKRLSESSTQGLEEFKNEVILFAKLQHSNLVRLLGCCVEGEERMLIYEYLQNKSLDYLIFDQDRRTLLTWPKRYDIILGITRGLLYLHHDSRLKIIHRDLKTSNILLDENMNPKIADFGLAKTFIGDQFMARTRRVIGTYGYMAPEYAMDGKFSVKSDIFSLGVVILEIVSGRKNRGFNHHDHHHSLLGHIILADLSRKIGSRAKLRRFGLIRSSRTDTAWLMWQEGKVLEIMDECLKDTCVEFQVKRSIQVALLFIQKLIEDRPTMLSVHFMLGCEEAPVPEPKEPGFFIERSSGTSTVKKSINETITITELVAR